MHTQSAHAPTQSQALGVKPIDAATWAVSSSKPFNPPYLVRKSGDGSYKCDCASFIYRHTGAGDPCKHCQAVAASQEPRPAHPPTSWCFSCGEWPVKGHALICEHCAGKVRESDAADVAATQHLMGETMRDLLAATAAPAERNARAVAAHRLEGTLVVSSRPSPLEAAGYGG